MTKAFMLAVLLIVGAYDVSCWLGLTGAPTISATVRGWARAYPLPVCGGYLLLAALLYWHLFLEYRE